MFFSKTVKSPGWGIDRPGSIELYQSIISSIGLPVASVLDAPTGGGKTFTVARSIHGIADKLGAKCSFNFLTPTTSTIGSAVADSYVAIESMIRSKRNVILCFPEKYVTETVTEQFKNLSALYPDNLSIIHEYTQAFIEYQMSSLTTLVVIDSVQKIIDYRWKYFEYAIKQFPAMVIIDEFHHGFSASSPENYVLVTENSRQSFSGKKLEKLLAEDILNLDHLTIIGLSGTPTLEHREVIKTDKSKFRYVPLPRTHYIQYLKSVDSLKVIMPKNGLNNTPEIIECIDIFHNLNQHRSNLNNNHCTMIKVGNGVISKIKRKRLAKGLDNFLFYTSTHGLNKIGKDGRFIKIDTSLTNVRSLLNNPLSPWNTLVVNQAGTMGFDIPEIDTIADLSTNQKMGEQYSSNQYLGRGIRKNTKSPNTGLHMFLMATPGLFNRMRKCAKFWYGDQQEYKSFMNNLVIPEFQKHNLIRY